MVGVNVYVLMARAQRGTRARFLHPILLAQAGGGVQRRKELATGTSK